jgi:hypothetical protein
MTLVDHKLCIDKNLEGGIHGFYFKALSWHLLGESEQKHENLQSSKMVAQLGFNFVTSKYVTNAIPAVHCPPKSFGLLMLNSPTL